MTTITKVRKIQAGWYSVAVVGTGRDALTLDIKNGRDSIFLPITTWGVTYQTGVVRSDRNCIACFDRLGNATAFAIAAAEAARAGEAMPNPAAFEEGSSSHCPAWNDVILPLAAELAA